MTYTIEKRVMDDGDKTIINEFDKWMGPKLIFNRKYFLDSNSYFKY